MDKTKAKRKTKSKTNESSKHILAKHLVRDYLNSGNTIVVSTGCNSHFNWVYLSTKTSNVKCEVTYNSPYGVSIFDVMWEQDNTLYGIEVKVTHKSNSDTRVGVNWFEITATEILKNIPHQSCENTTVTLKDIRSCTTCSNQGMRTHDPRYKLHLNTYTDDGFRIGVISGMIALSHSTLSPYDDMMYEIMTSKRVTHIATWNKSYSAKYISPEMKQHLLNHYSCIGCGKRRGKKGVCIYKPLCRECYQVKTQKPYYVTTPSDSSNDMWDKYNKIMTFLSDKFGSRCVCCGSSEMTQYGDRLNPICNSCLVKEVKSE